MANCCSLPVDENGQLIEILEIKPTPTRAENICPECKRTGKRVDEATLKSMLSSSLRNIQKHQYFFCRIRSCPVVYFSGDGEQTFTTDQVRERVYQKEPEAEDVFACYCFQHTVGEVQTACSEERLAILDDINAGVKAG